jgi:hypothetical protein
MRTAPGLLLFYIYISHRSDSIMYAAGPLSLLHISCTWTTAGHHTSPHSSAAPRLVRSNQAARALVSRRRCALGQAVCPRVHPCK